MSSYHEQIEAMISYKESLGYTRRTYACYLNDLDSYLAEAGVDEQPLSVYDIMPWCVQRSTEKPESYRRRATAAREFTKYLYAMGLCDGILSMDSVPRVRRYTPYIFTDAELLALFQKSDNQKGDPRNPLSPDIIATVYRLIYFCGLRPNEGREIRRNDIDTDNRTLLIRENKTHKERLIPMAEDVAELCSGYISKRDILFPDSEYLFPSPDGSPYPAKWLTRHFLHLWRQAYPQDQHKRVRVYDFRHRFATAVLMDWLDRGEDLYTALPYLSAYMGHSDFRDTAYYIHLLPDRLLKTSSIEWSRFSALIPEVPGYE